MSHDEILGLAQEPVADGVEFYRAVERAFPDLTRRALFLTGDAISSHDLEFRRNANARFLPKPFDVADLQRLVRRVSREPDGSREPRGP